MNVQYNVNVTQQARFGTRSLFAAMYPFRKEKYEYDVVVSGKAQVYPEYVVWYTL